MALFRVLGNTSLSLRKKNPRTGLGKKRLAHSCQSVAKYYVTGGRGCIAHVKSLWGKFERGWRSRAGGQSRDSGGTSLAKGGMIVEFLRGKEGEPDRLSCQRLLDGGREKHFNPRCIGQSTKKKGEGEQVHVFCWSARPQKRIIRGSERKEKEITN